MDVRKTKRLINLYADAMDEALETAEVAAMVIGCADLTQRKESDVKRTQKNALIVKAAKSDLGGFRTRVPTTPLTDQIELCSQ